MRVVLVVFPWRVRWWCCWFRETLILCSISSSTPKNISLEYGKENFKLIWLFLLCLLCLEWWCTWCLLMFMNLVESLHEIRMSGYTINSHEIHKFVVPSLLWLNKNPCSEAKKWHNGAFNFRRFRSNGSLVQFGHKSDRTEHSSPSVLSQR